MKKILEIVETYKTSKYLLKEFKKGQTIFLEGAKCSKIGIVKSGKIKIASHLKDGREVVYNRLTTNGVFGGNLIFSSDTSFKGDVIAEEDSQIYLISKADVVKLIQTNDEFLEVFMRYQSDFSKELNFKIQILTFNTAEERLMYYIETHGPKVRVESVTSLAENLFLTRESLSRTIHKLEENKKIKYRAKILQKIN